MIPPQGKRDFLRVMRKQSAGDHSESLPLRGRFGSNNRCEEDGGGDEFIRS